jgi:hypothetical protein
MEKALIEKVVQYNDELIEFKKTHEKLTELITLSKEFKDYDKQNPIVIKTHRGEDFIPQIPKEVWFNMLNIFILSIGKNITKCEEKLNKL